MTLAANVTDVSASHPVNTVHGKLVRLLGISTDVKAVQFPNAQRSTSTTDSGSTIDVNELQ